MVGEIRDTETASIATHAALTGHLVLSTLHTNEAVGAIALVDRYGNRTIPYNVFSYRSFRPKRLIVKRYAHLQRKSYTVDEDVLRRVGMKEGTPARQGMQRVPFLRGCNLKEEGLFELLLVTEGIKKLIIEKAPASEIKAQAIKEGFRTMRQEGLLKAVEGITTIEEVMRVTHEAE